MKTRRIQASHGNPEAGRGAEHCTGAGRWLRNLILSVDEVEKFSTYCRLRCLRMSASDSRSF